VGEPLVQDSSRALKALKKCMFWGSQESSGRIIQLGLWTSSKISHAGSHTQSLVEPNRKIYSQIGMNVTRTKSIGENRLSNPICKSKHGVCPSVCGDKNKTRSWNERGPQNLRGPEPRWPESSIKDLNQDSQYSVQTSRRTWNEVPRKKTRRWGPKTRSSERKLVVRVPKRGCTSTDNSRFQTYWRRTDSRTQLRFNVGWCFWVTGSGPLNISDPKSPLLPVLWKNRPGQPLRGAGRGATGG
jgi:hypothetical protein